MSTIINANDVELYVTSDLKDSIKQIEHHLHYKPKFVIINASDNEANKRYIKAKVKMAEQLGLQAIVDLKPFLTYSIASNKVIYPIIGTIGHLRVFAIISQFSLLSHQFPTFTSNNMNPTLSFR
jgi:5,10-methylene-tetrahydrofolate dehydrogenase/methenyl tetrahydrofolate cyclohydrolase